MHYAIAFLPGIGYQTSRLTQHAWQNAFIWTPLGFLFDGTSAVCLFFIMSGVALTYAFSGRAICFRTEMARRLIRLGLPMAVAVLLAAGVLALLPDAPVVAGERYGPLSFLDMRPKDVSIAAIAHQIAFEGLLTGFRGLSLLPDWTTGFLHLAFRGQGFDSPLWTLHYEFYGSLLLLVLVTLRKSSNRILHPVACLCAGCGSIAIGSPVSLFVLGHLATIWIGKTDRYRWHGPLGIAALILGLLLCSTQAYKALLGMTGLSSLNRMPWLDVVFLQKTIGCALIFGGLTLIPSVQRHLERPIARWLGKISFSLYLTHFPLLFIWIAALFVHLPGTWPYSMSAAIVGAVGIGTSLALAVPFERWVDRPTIALSRRAGLLRSGTVAAAPILRQRWQISASARR